MRMKSKNDIKRRYIQTVMWLLSEECVWCTGTAVKAFHTARELYWVLGGEGKFPLKMFPEKEIVDKEKLYSVVGEEV